VSEARASRLFRNRYGGATIRLLLGFNRILSHVPRSLWLPIIALLGGTLLLPVACYLAGARLIAPYEGPHGLSSYFGAIYADAARAQPLALALILGPALIVVIWKMNRWAWRLTAR
jgi:hypothetical protein